MIRRAAAALLCVSVLAGCGGGSDAPEPDREDPKPPPTIGRPGADPEAAEELGFPGFATKNTTRIGGADPIANAAGVARAVYPATSAASRPRTVVVVDVDDWRTAISAAQLMARPVRAPVLFSRDGELPEASRQALEELEPREVVRIGRDAATVEEGETTEIAGSEYAELARAIDRLHARRAKARSDAVIVAPADGPAYAMPAAGYAAKAGVPVLWTLPDRVPAATRAAIQDRKQPRIYVVGPEDVASDRVLKDLAKMGPTERIDGPDAVRNAIAFARYADSRFGWNVVDPGHGLVFASAERTADAVAGAPLSASGKYGPLLLVSDAQQLPGPLESYLLDIQPGYQNDPVRGVYNHGWLLGDESAISLSVQSRVDALLEIQPVDPIEE